MHKPKVYVEASADRDPLEWKVLGFSDGKEFVRLNDGNYIWLRAAIVQPEKKIGEQDFKYAFRKKYKNYGESGVVETVIDLRKRHYNSRKEFLVPDLLPAPTTAFEAMIRYFVNKKELSHSTFLVDEDF